MPYKKKKVLIKKRSSKSPPKKKLCRHQDRVGTSGTSSTPSTKCNAIRKTSPVRSLCDKGGVKRIYSPFTIKPVYDKSGVKRIYSPFNRFANSSTHLPKTHRANKMSHQSQSVYPCTGLSSKERSYVISSCQARSYRYSILKTMASNAMKQNKVFTIYGYCKPVRHALLDRGWVEKIPANRMNLMNIRNGSISNQSDIHCELERILLSNLVEKHTPNFIWFTSDDVRDNTIDLLNETNTLINRLKIEAMWTSKQGLCSSMKGNYWFYIDNVSEVITPRTYNSYDIGEIDGFVKDFRMTACTSLLKWILSMVANEKPIFHGSGKISFNVFLFALNRCKEYLLRKQHRDIDKNLNTPTAGQWKTFLRHYYSIIENKEIFKAEDENNLKVYLGYAKFLLKQIYKYRPQLSCEGCHNVWIIKPAHCSRGRGIKMASQLSIINEFITKANAKYVLQKYIEDPLLIHDTKFDIRQYYLVTNTFPLVVWMYKDCYLKFSSQKYNLKDFHESVHLTNNAVQRKYKNCSNRHPDLPANNMWESDTYKEYLNKNGKSHVWDNIIYPGMKKCIVGIMLSCQDSLFVNKNRFELYGCDFILDKEYKPWLIEINSRPDLNHTTLVTGKICPAVITDIIKVVIDNASNPQAPTGRFECIYRQPMTMPRYGGVADLIVKGRALPNDYFYRGKLDLKQSSDDPYFGKLKNESDSEIMIAPENDELQLSDDGGIDPHDSDNEDVITVASVVTAQINEILEKISSSSLQCSSGRKRKSKPLANVLSTSKSLNALKNVRSITDMKKIFKIPLTKSNFVDSFSKIDDGSTNGSIHEIKKVASRHVYNNFKGEESGKCDGTRTSKLGSKTFKEAETFEETFAEVTSRIINFIKNKEREYVSDVFISE